MEDVVHTPFLNVNIIDCLGSADINRNADDKKNVVLGSKIQLPTRKEPDLLVCDKWGTLTNEKEELVTAAVDTISI